MSLESTLMSSVFPVEAARNHLQRALQLPQTIAPLPRVCTQLAEMSVQQVTDAAHLAKLIQSDASLAGEVMRVANSPALRPRAAVVSLQQAVSWLGVAEVRNIAMAVMLRGEIFTAPGHERESEELWQEAWLAGLWAKEIARERRKHVESAFLAALMHRSGAALTLKILSRYEVEQRAGLDARTFGDLVVEFEPLYGRKLMDTWRIPSEVQDGATDWRNYRESTQADLAGTVHAAHVLATHTLFPQLMHEDLVVECPVFEQLGIFPEARRVMLAKSEHVRSLAGM